MDVKPKMVGRPKILTLVGAVIIGLGILLVPLGLIKTFVSYLKQDGEFFLSLYSFYDVIGTAIGICGFGLAVARGRRWHLFGLLNIVFFGSLLIGLFSMIGKETNIGYYIWAIGGTISLLLIVILVTYWENLVDG